MIKPVVTKAEKKIRSQIRANRVLLAAAKATRMRRKKALS